MKKLTLRIEFDRADGQVSLEVEGAKELIVEVASAAIAAIDTVIRRRQQEALLAPDDVLGTRPVDKP